MPTPTKFTAETRQKILQALQVGASRRTAAAIAGVDHTQVQRWMKKGSDAASGTRFREFYEDVNRAEASPRMRALGVIYKELPDNPGLAWKFIERTEPGYAPPMPQMQAAPAQPVLIHLSFHDGGPLDSGTIDAFIEGEAVEQDDPAPQSVVALPPPTPAGGSAT